MFDEAAGPDGSIPAAAFARLLTDNHAPFTAATDNPYLVHTNPKRELDILAPKENSLPIREWALACGEKFSFTS